MSLISNSTQWFKVAFFKKKKLIASLLDRSQWERFSFRRGSGPEVPQHVETVSCSRRAARFGLSVALRFNMFSAASLPARPTLLASSRNFNLRSTLGGLRPGSPSACFRPSALFALHALSQAARFGLAVPVRASTCSTQRHWQRDRLCSQIRAVSN